jgi:hypothetical protein
LDRQGTLDTGHVLQYMSWKRRPLSEEVLEVCKFLRSVESGGGSSDGGALHALKYAKSLGGRGDLLPRTMETCWRKIAKVSLNVHCDVHGNVHCEVRSDVRYQVNCNVHCEVRCTVHCDVHCNVHGNVRSDARYQVSCNVHRIVRLTVPCRCL